MVGQRSMLRKSVNCHGCLNGTVWGFILAIAFVIFLPNKFDQTSTCPAHVCCFIGSSFSNVAMFVPSTGMMDKTKTLKISDFGAPLWKCRMHFLKNIELFFSELNLIGLHFKLLPPWTMSCPTIPFQKDLHLTRAKNKNGTIIYNSVFFYF